MRTDLCEVCKCEISGDHYSNGYDTRKKLKGFWGKLVGTCDPYHEITFLSELYNKQYCNYYTTTIKICKSCFEGMLPTIHKMPGITESIHHPGRLYLTGQSIFNCDNCYKEINVNNIGLIEGNSVFKIPGFEYLGIQYVEFTYVQSAPRGYSVINKTQCLSCIIKEL